jgi:hypothetical protein
MRSRLSSIRIASLRRSSSRSGCRSSILARHLGAERSPRRSWARMVTKRSTCPFRRGSALAPLWARLGVTGELPCSLSMKAR